MGDNEEELLLASGIVFCRLVLEAIIALSRSN